MSGSRDEASSADRRWFIGVAISLVFGLFGVVMALLAYADRNKPAPVAEPSAASTTVAKPTMAPAGPTKPTAAPAATPAPSASAEPVVPAASSPASGSKKKHPPK